MLSDDIQDASLQYDSSQTSQQENKVTTASSKRIALIPKPSNDPNDPLNWPLWQKDLMFGILCLMSALSVSNGSNIAQDMAILAGYFNRGFADIALLSAYLYCGCGVAGAVVVPISRICGHRLLYILGALIITTSCIWAGQSRSYEDLFWARILQGVGTAPFEALMSVTVSDMYFVHVSR
jgi:MFS family permease